MRRSVSWFVVLVLVAASPAAFAARADSTRVARRPTGPVEAGWPDSRAGTLGWKWVTAFNSGPEAMRHFYEEDLAASSRADRNVEVRLARYRELKKQFGSLAFASVASADSAEVKVELLDADLASHTFIFKSEKSAPWKLLSVGMLQTIPGGHGGGFHH